MLGDQSVQPFNKCQRLNPVSNRPPSPTSVSICPGNLFIDHLTFPNGGEETDLLILHWSFQIASVLRKNINRNRSSLLSCPCQLEDLILVTISNSLTDLINWIRINFGVSHSSEILSAIDVLVKNYLLKFKSSSPLNLSTSKPFDTSGVWRHEAYSEWLLQCSEIELTDLMVSSSNINEQLELSESKYNIVSFVIGTFSMCKDVLEEFWMRLRRCSNLISGLHSIANESINQSLTKTDEWSILQDSIQQHESTFSRFQNVFSRVSVLPIDLHEVIVETMRQLQELRMFCTSTMKTDENIVEVIFHARLFD